MEIWSCEEVHEVIRLKRAYEPAAASDGHRVLIDRLWPRGLTKEEANIDTWLKDVAPSDTLRKWFGHDPDRFREFQKRYEHELHTEPARTLVDGLAQQAASGTVTLVYSAHDKEHNNAVVLAHAIERRLRAASRGGRSKPPAVKRVS